LRPVLQQVRDSELVSNVQAPRCQIAQGQAEYDFRRGRLGTPRVRSENRHEVVLLRASENYSTRFITPVTPGGRAAQFACSQLLPPSKVL
jgi:hypothetical protein